MSDIPIATIIHLSDLHFGDQLENREHWWHTVLGLTKLQARFTHDYQAIRSLQLIVHEICEHRTAAGVPVVLLHSGDLTANGADAEFAVGESFLSTLGDVQEVPGNHDKWQFTVGEPPPGYRAHFPKAFPHSCRLGEIVLHLFDSNKHGQRVWDATGFISEPALDAACGEMNRNEGLIQIVVIHHPVHMDGLEDDTRLRLDDREDVGRRLAAAGASLVLSGHVHVSRLYGATTGRPAQYIAGSAAQFRGPKSFLVIDVYDSGFDPHEYGMSPDNQFLEIMEEQTQTPPPCS